MRLLVGFSWLDVVLGVLWVSLGILVLLILYRLLLRRLSAGSIDKRNYCELYDLESNPVIGEVKFYFTSGSEREVRLCIYNQNLEHVQDVKVFQCKTGGNIVRFESTGLPNGNYFYGLETENQKIMKKMRIQNVLA